MVEMIAGIVGEVYHRAGSRKMKEATARAKAAMSEAKRNDPIRALKEKVRRHGYRTEELSSAVAVAEKRLSELRTKLEELDLKSVQLEDLAYRKKEIQPSARSVEFDRVAMRPLIARAVDEVASARASLEFHMSMAVLPAAHVDHDAGTDDEHSDAPDDESADPAERDFASAPKRGRPPKVTA